MMWKLKKPYLPQVAFGCSANHSKCRQRGSRHSMRCPSEFWGATREGRPAMDKSGFLGGGGNTYFGEIVVFFFF